MRFFVLGCVDANTVFPVCIYRYQNGWDCEGTAGSLTSGFPIGVKAPFGTRFYGIKSSVLYLLRPLVPERRCCLTEHTISGDSRTDGFRVPLGQEICGFAYAKSGCSGVGGVAECRKSVKQIFEIEQHHRGSKRYITLPSRRSDKTPVIRAYSGINHIGNQAASSCHQGSSSSALSTASSSNVLAYPRVKPKCFAVSSIEWGVSSSPNPRR